MSAVIAGIGVDIAHIPRFERTLRQFGERFLLRAFHAREAATVLDHVRRIVAGTASAEDVRNAATFVASRWAAKEALTKALKVHRPLFPEVEVAPDTLRSEDASTHVDFNANAASTSDSSRQDAGVDLPAAAAHAAASLEARVRDATARDECGAAASRAVRAPRFIFHGAAADIVAKERLVAHLSLTHDGLYAAAFVVCERLPRDTDPQGPPPTQPALGAHGTSHLR